MVVVSCVKFVCSLTLKNSSSLSSFCVDLVYLLHHPTIGIPGFGCLIMVKLSTNVFLMKLARMNCFTLLLTSLLTWETKTSCLLCPLPWVGQTAFDPKFAIFFSCAHSLVCSISLLFPWFFSCFNFNPFVLKGSCKVPNISSRCWYASAHISRSLSPFVDDVRFFSCFFCLFSSCRKISNIPFHSFFSKEFNPSDILSVDATQYGVYRTTEGTLYDKTFMDGNIQPSSTSVDSVSSLFYLFFFSPFFLPVLPQRFTEAIKKYATESDQVNCTVWKMNYGKSSWGKRCKQSWMWKRPSQSSPNTNKKSFFVLISQCMVLYCSNNPCPFRLGYGKTIGRGSSC